ncbi:MAG: serine/threonine-protein kinase [Pseudomonadota bacterium]|nr:serine/threonine-protein kinase [Pseudomonadota bacterium]
MNALSKRVDAVHAAVATGQPQQTSETRRRTYADLYKQHKDASTLPDCTATFPYSPSENNPPSTFFDDAKVPTPNQREDAVQTFVNDEFFRAFNEQNTALRYFDCSRRVLLASGDRPDALLCARKFVETTGLPSASAAVIAGEVKRRAATLCDEDMGQALSYAMQLHEAMPWRSCVWSFVYNVEQIVLFRSTGVAQSRRAEQYGPYACMGADAPGRRNLWALVHRSLDDLGFSAPKPNAWPHGADFNADAEPFDGGASGVVYRCASRRSVVKVFHQSKLDYLRHELAAYDALFPSKVDDTTSSTTSADNDDSKTLARKVSAGDNWIELSDCGLRCANAADRSIVFADVVRALRFAHTRANRVHCDIRPQNIVIASNQDHAVLVDWGFSSHIDDWGIASGASVGRRFAAPELLGENGREHYTPRDDLVSLVQCFLYLKELHMCVPHSDDEQSIAEFWRRQRAECAERDHQLFDAAEACNYDELIRLWSPRAPGK